MLASRRDRFLRFTRQDAVRLTIAALVLITSLTAIFAVDIFPARFRAELGEPAQADVVAPRTAQYESPFLTEQARNEAALAVPPQYNYSAEAGQAAAVRQSAELELVLQPVDAAFTALLPEEVRRTALAAALPDLSEASLATLQDLTPLQWSGLRTEMLRVLEAAQRREVRDTELPSARAALSEMVMPRFGAAQRTLAGEILSSALVANSTYDAAATERARVEASAAVAPVVITIQTGETLVERGQRIDEVALERLELFSLRDPRPDPAKLGGWILLAVLLVGMLLGWVWRFRPELWHRDNALILVGLILVVATLALRLTGDRSVLPYFMPVAAVGLLLAVLLDSSAALVVTGVVAIVTATITGSVELASYVFLGGMAGIIVVRRGERLAHFVQAAMAITVVNLAVVTIFTLLGERDLTGILQLWGASLVSAGGSAVAAVGTFAVLGSLFHITTSFQLLELANPSQPLLRRLLLETPGTYHHSLMVGNLGERAAEAIGADPLLTRVAAYYHDIGKLANPMAYIENQAGAPNIHDELTPEQSAALLKSHVASGIDLAYEYRLPKTLISFIPQHHGTALMSFFYARAITQALTSAGVEAESPQAASVRATVDESRFRHAGPKPQSREAAILMLADGVEASVRSLVSQDEPVIRAMVVRIIRERLEDGQFDECDLTIRDLDLVREAFIAQLLGMYHRRIEYPQNKIVEIESQRATERV